MIERVSQGLVFAGVGLVRNAFLDLQERRYAIARPQIDCHELRTVDAAESRGIQQV